MTGNAPTLRDFSGRVVLVGAGKMGGALLEGWLRFGLQPKSVAVVEPNPAPQIAALEKDGALINPDTGKIANADAIVVAVKPQIASQALPSLSPMIGASTVVVSIMAGRTLHSISSALDRPCALVRAMPNTPAAIGRGITVAVAQQANEAQRDLAYGLLSAAGTIEWIDDETLMDAVTAVSGSGPAYVFLLAEALAEAGVASGLPPALAAKLARETVAGSGELLHRDTLDPSILRQNVTSPGGTTAAALDVLMAKDGLTELMKKSVAAATRRSRELAG